MSIRRPGPGLSNDLLAQASEWRGLSEDPTICERGPWTLSALKRCARIAVSRCRISPGSLRDDPYRLAELGIGLAIAVNPNVPEVEAIFAAQNEIFAARQAVRKDEGKDRGGSPAPNFCRYWLTEQPRFAQPADVDNRLTLSAVLAGLPPEHLDTLILLAWTDSTKAAALAAGCSTQAMLIRARKARRAALELWFDQETPPDLKRLLPYRVATRTCREGHEISGDNVRWETSATGRRHARCKACRNARDRERSSHDG